MNLGFFFTEDSEVEGPCTRSSRANKKLKPYSPEDVENAIEKILSQALSIKAASQTYKVPVTTLKFKLRALKPKRKTPLLKMAVTNEEDFTFKKHLLQVHEMGIPVTFHDIIAVVKAYLTEADKGITCYRSNSPGSFWCKQFMQRYPEVKEIIAANQHNTKGRIVPNTPRTINNFFNRFEDELYSNYVTPDNIYTMDECGFGIDPKKKNLLFRRSSRHPDLDKLCGTSNYSVVFCGNAIGELIDPFFIFKESVPAPSEHPHYSASTSGWIDTSVFDDWLEKHFVPTIDEKHGKKILICDNLSAHVSVKALQICAENNIALICPLGNSSHLHPFDFEFYETMQTAWRAVLYSWHRTSTGQLTRWQKKSLASTVNLGIPKDVFCKLVNRAIENNESSSENIVNGFAKCGIYPLSREVVLESLLQEKGVTIVR
ncbi:jerky protein homolog-like [Spodoptera frugiperda]|uniref:Jerky protein homolog-like n=1 Tax=Spodoptera frugiperda TaxID=7108 RepID=A0A9R0EDP2_SPOFR|nr:jerky protein homolog-like [Spodoptera frugiperda]